MAAGIGRPGERHPGRTGETARLPVPVFAKAGHYLEPPRDPPGVQQIRGLLHVGDVKQSGSPVGGAGENRIIEADNLIARAVEVAIVGQAAGIHAGLQLVIAGGGNYRQECVDPAFIAHARLGGGQEVVPAAPFRGKNVHPAALRRLAAEELVMRNAEFEHQPARRKDLVLEAREVLPPAKVEGSR